MKLIFLGPPGAGKGTIAKMIKNNYKILHISTGDLFRAAVKNETPLGLKVKDILNAGGLIPDELTIELVKDRLQQNDVAEGYILDGFPRTIPQAEALSEFTAINAVLNFKIEKEDVIIQRLTGRRTCKACGAIFHIQNNPPRTEGVCDNCGKELYTRADDEISAVTQRLEVYKKQTAPLIAYYENTGLLKDIDASQNPETTRQQVADILKKL